MCNVANYFATFPGSCTIAIPLRAFISPLPSLFFQAAFPSPSSPSTFDFQMDERSFHSLWHLCHSFLVMLTILIIFFISSKFIYVNYNTTFHFTKKESSYIAGSVYMVSMLFGPAMGLFVVRQIEKFITLKFQMLNCLSGKNF